MTGGSDSYVRAISERLGSRLQVGNGVRSLRRTVDGVELRTDDGTTRPFDGVVVATHADQALAARLPKARSARGSWNYRLADDGKPTLTYYLNRLQTLDGDTDWCLTLNGDIADERLVDSEDGLAEVARSAPLALAGRGASSSIAEPVGAYLEDDPVTAAARVADGADAGASRA